MKRISLLLMMVCLVLAGCASKETKANKLIKDYMFKHLHDFKSYEVVETKIDTLYNSPVFDAECLALAADINEHYDKSDDYDRDASSDQRSMDIWSGGWSATARSEYKEAASSYVDNSIKSCQEKILAFKSWKKLLEKLPELPGDKQIGWLVTHTFRSNNLAGNSSLGNYIFLMDKGFKEIIDNFDVEDEERGASAETIRTLIEDADVDLDTARIDSLIVNYEGMIGRLQDLKKKF